MYEIQGAYLLKKTNGCSVQSSKRSYKANRCGQLHTPSDTLPSATPTRLWQTGLSGECIRGKLLWPKPGTQLDIPRSNVYHTFLALFRGMWLYSGENGCNRTHLNAKISPSPREWSERSHPLPAHPYVRPMGLKNLRLSPFFTGRFALLKISWVKVGSHLE